jgi:hypothetical protein
MIRPGLHCVCYGPVNYVFIGFYFNRGFWSHSCRLFWIHSHLLNAKYKLWVGKVMLPFVTHNIIILFFFLLSYFTILSVLRLCSIDNRMINECGAVSGIKIYRKNWSMEKKPSQCHSVHHKSYMNLLGPNPAAIIGSWQLTTQLMTQPHPVLCLCYHFQSNNHSATQICLWHFQITIPKLVLSYIT